MRRMRPLDGLDADLRHFLECEIEENVARGMSPEEARRQAMVKFGNLALVREDTRAVWVLVWAEHLLQDVRYALRTLRGNLRFAAVVIATLAVAIGMTTAIFSVFNAVVLRPLAYPHAERLVWLSTVGMEGEAGLVTGPDFADWREQAQSFERMAAYSTSSQTVVSPAGAARVRSAAVTADFWELSGAIPIAGRLPRSGEPDVVMVMPSVARRGFNSESNAVGRAIRLDDRQATVVGVLPDAFRFHLPSSIGSDLRSGDVDVYRPLTVSSGRDGPMQLLNVAGRLKSGATLDAARAEMETIRARLAERHPAPFGDLRTLRMVPLHDQLVGGADRALLVLLGAVFCVLLIACANAANLLLARGSARQREIAVRIAVGAGRGRLLMQLLVETLVLAIGGSAAGLLLAHAGVALILAMNPEALPRLAETRIDGAVLTAALGVCGLSVLLAGLAPALALWGIGPHEALKASGRAAPAGAASVRTRRMLVAGEVAIALVLLVGTGLMLKSAWRMHAYPPGFTPDRVLAASLELMGAQYSDTRQRQSFAGALLERLEREPGVEVASLSTHGSAMTAGLMIEGEPKSSLEDLVHKTPIMLSATTATLKEVLGLRVVRGRWFTDDEAAVVLNESLVNRDLAGRNPIGRRLRLTDGGPLLTIVGVVADLKFSKLDAPAEPELFVPYSRLDDSLFEFTTLVRTTNDPLTLAPAVRSTISDLDRSLVPGRLATLEQMLDESIAPRRLNLALFGTFGAAALFLAVIGIYGVMAYAVAQRGHEIGVRMALGARRRDVVAIVVRQGMRVTLIGVGAGILGASVLTRFMESLLFDVHPTDVSTFAAVAVVLAATGLLACCGPALKAALVDPVEALRCE